MTRKGYCDTSGPIVINGKVMQGLRRLRALRTRRRCFISGYDATPASCSGSSTRLRAGGEPGGDTWGKLPDTFRAGGETWIAGSYDPELNLTYWGVAQAKPWMPASRGNSVFDAALYSGSTVALQCPTMGSWRGTSSTFPANRSTSTKCSSACWSTPDGRKTVFTIGKAGILWKLDRRTGEFVGAQGDGVPERLRPDRSRRPASLTYRADIIEQKVERVGARRARAPRAATTGRR